MVSILGKPVLQHQIELCKKNNFTNIALLVKYQHEKISQYFRDGSAFGVKLGTLSRVNSEVLLGLWEMHCLARWALYVALWRHFPGCGPAQNVGCPSSLWCRRNFIPTSQWSSMIQISSMTPAALSVRYCLIHILGSEVRNLVNAGFMFLNALALKTSFLPKEKWTLLSTCFLGCLISAALYGFVSPEYIKDMGTPERLDKVERDLIAGLPNVSTVASCEVQSSSTEMVRSTESNHLRSPEQVELLLQVPTIRKLNRSGKLAVVITNQPVVARGEVSFEELWQIHARLESMLGSSGALDRIYFCPHHPNKGFLGEVLNLRTLPVAN